MGELRKAFGVNRCLDFVEPLDIPAEHDTKHLARAAAMNEADITAARAMLRANGISVAEVWRG